MSLVSKIKWDNDDPVIVFTKEDILPYIPKGKPVDLICDELARDFDCSSVFDQIEEHVDLIVEDLSTR